MLDQVLAVSSRGPMTFATFMAVGLVVSAIVVAVFIAIAMIPSAAGERLDAERARLFTHSEAFWARWPNNRVFEAPYDELAGEAIRCERVIEIYQRQRGTNVRPASGPARQVYDESNRQIATYQGLLAAVQHAIAQGRGPQLPSN